MDSNLLYEEILKKTSDGFVKIKVIKDANNKFIDYEILDYNNILIRILNADIKGNEIDKNDLKEIIQGRLKNTIKCVEAQDFLTKVEENKFHSVSFFIDDFHKDMVLEGYCFGDYFIVIIKFSLIDDAYRFSELLKDSKNIYFWLKDKKGDYINFNKKWSKIVNLDKFISGNRISSRDIWTEEEYEQFSLDEKEVMEKNKVKSFIQRFKDSQGIDRVIDTTLWPVLDKENKVIGTMGIAVDADDKVQFYSRLEENERSFREITKYCDSVFFIRDQKTVTYMSTSYEKMFEEPYDKLLDDVYRFNDFFKNSDNKHGILENYSFEKLNEGKLKAKLRNGKEKWIWYKFLPIYNESGEIIKRVGILNDVTRSVELEEEKEKIRLDFFINLSHELRTPINVISTSIQVLKLKLNKIDKGIFGHISDYVDIMERSVSRLTKLTNNLIDSTKIDSGSMNMNLINTDIVSFIEDTCFSTLPIIKSKNMNLIFDTDTEEEIISFDPEIIERVMLNILSNAVKFNKEKGNIFVNLVSDENFINVEVKDEGIGIPRDNIKTIFDRFERVRTKMKSETEGSGVGLYLVKSLVEMHGGEVEVISEEGKGSVFTFKLPRRIIESKDIEPILNKDDQRSNVILEFSDIYM